MRTSTRTHSLRLLHAFSATLAALVPIAACGGSSTSDSGDAGTEAGTDGNCGGGEQTIMITYMACVDPGDAALPGDAASDASADADADGGVGPACESSCAQACGHTASGIGGPGGIGFLQTCSDTGVRPDGTMGATCTFLHPCGRRPMGLSRARSTKGSAIARHLATSAWMEAASVVAFERMAKELKAHGAPRSLVRAARQASKDEVRHAHAMTKLARARGAEPPRPKVRERGVRSLEAIARENAVEGCVRETYGALLAAWQSELAQDAEVRRAMKRIADDERRHAALAMAVSRWAEPRLDTKARDRVARHKHRAIVALEAEVASALPEALVRDAGLPSPAIAKKLVASLAPIWS